MLFAYIPFGLAITIFLPIRFVIAYDFLIRFYALSIETSGFDLILELGTEIFVIYCLSDMYSSFKSLTSKRGEW